MGRRGGGVGFLLRGGGELCAPGGGGGATDQKDTIKNPQKTFYVGKKIFPFLKNGIFKTVFVDFYLDLGKKFSGQARGGQ